LGEQNKEKQIPRRDYLKYAAGVAAVAAVAGVGYGVYEATKPPPTPVSTTATVTAPVTQTATVTVTPTSQVQLKLWSEASVIYTIMNGISTGFQTQNPNVKISIDQNDTLSYQQAIFTRFKSTDAPDVAWMWGGLTWVPDLADAGLIRNMDDYADQFGWRKILQPAALSGYLLNNSFFFIPHHGVTYPYFYYNKDLFQKQGWKISTFDNPMTVDDFVSQAAEIKKAGYLGLTLGLKDVWPAEHLLSHFIVGNLDPDAANTFVNDYGAALTQPGHYSKIQLRWTDSSIEKMFEQLAAWGPAVAVPNAGSLDYSSALALFTSGKAAMWQDGIWSVSGLKSGIKGAFDFDFMQIPTNKTKTVQTGFFNGWVVAARSKYVDEDAAWLNYAYSPTSELIAANNSFIPGTTNIPADQITDPFINTVLKQLSPSGYNYSGGPSVFTLLNGKLATQYRQNAGQVMQGLMKPQDAVNNLESLAKTISQGG
jgi:raffinose/stachyose/melibiose transport system substrate-binding protein